jgi:hypothetical protein
MEDILVPLGFFIMVVLIVWFGVKARMRRHQMEHDERMLALEKGVLIPSVPVKQRHRNPYLWPFVLIAIGLAFLAKDIIESDAPGLTAYVPLLIGAGMLIAHQWYQSRHPKEINGNGTPQPGAQVQETQTIKPE